MRTQKLNNSAVAVQKHWKRFYYQRRYKQLRVAAIYVQNCKLQIGRGQCREECRGESVKGKGERGEGLWTNGCLGMRKGIARATLGRLREDHAATQLQCVIRKYTQVKKYMQFRNSAIVLQKGSSSTNLLLLLFISSYPATFPPAITMYLIVSRSGACVLRSAKVRRDEARCGSDHSTNGDAQGEGYEVAQATCVWCG